MSEKDYNQNSVIFKLKRLKIQESNMTKNIEIFFSRDGLDTFLMELDAKRNVELEEIERLWLQFSDLKSYTMSKNINDEDVKEVKENILSLEKGIKNMKSNLKTKLAKLVEAEKQLTKLNQDDQDMNCLDDKKIRVRTFDDIVPSPVKIIRETPMKYAEIQEFDTFRQKYKQCGGWPEYNHNIFAKLWKKYYGSVNFWHDSHDSSEMENLNDEEVSMPDDCKFKKFSDELMSKVHGIELSDVVEHCKWYQKYCLLEQKKKKAIEKWQASKKISSCSYVPNWSIKTDDTMQLQPSKHYNSPVKIKDCGEPGKENRKITFDSNRKIDEGHKSKKNCLERLRKPTKQWEYRCYTDRETHSYGSFVDVDSVNKIKVPEWRALLE